MYIRDANIILLENDISSLDSFDHFYLNVLEIYVQLEQVIFALFGNENDLEDKTAISTEEGLNLLNKIIIFFKKLV